MKRHAIIPIFIPHHGCPNDCVFCNQKAITARERAPEPQEVRQRIEEHLSTLKNRGISTVEIAFFGGSFTGLSLEEQSRYLETAAEYKRSGAVDKLHLSTRPDYIDEEILDNLKKYGVDVIELGVQSFDDEVLRRSNRGHDSAVVYESCELIREYGFELGIQLMIGLPGDSYESCLYSAAETVRIRPSLARLYPTIVLKDTKLYQMWRSGEYTPFDQQETLRIAKDMYRRLDDAGIYILRVGLKSTELIQTEGGAVCSDYHPAFRQLVEGELAKEKLEEQLLSKLKVQRGTDSEEAELEAMMYSCGTSFSNMIGNRRANAVYFQEKYPQIPVRFCRDDSLKPGEYRCSVRVKVMRNGLKGAEAAAEEPGKV